MTLGEFRDRATMLACRHCRHVGLVESPRHPNNGGIRPHCPACGSVSPVEGIQWLGQSSVRDRRPHLGAKASEEVWHANGDTCSFCGITFDEAVALGIGRTAQHVVPYVEGGGEGPLIPFCARCHEASAAALRRTRDTRRGTASWREVVERIEKNHPRLRDDPSA
jgi:hypothetical protein